MIYSYGIRILVNLIRVICFQFVANSIFRITSHPSPLVGVKVIEGTNHFASLDVSGNLKVWDFKRFNCMQTINIESSEEKHAFFPQLVTNIPKPLKLVVAGRSMNFYEYDKYYNPISVDESLECINRRS